MNEKNIDELALELSCCGFGAIEEIKARFNHVEKVFNPPRLVTADDFNSLAENAVRHGG